MRPAARALTATITLEHRCPSCRFWFEAVPAGAGAVWVRCPRARCGERYLSLALPPGTTGRYLADVLGPRLAARAIRAYLPAMQGIDDDGLAILWAQVLVAATAPHQAYALLGALPATMYEFRAQAHHPVTHLLQTLGLKEAA